MPLDPHCFPELVTMRNKFTPVIIHELCHNQDVYMQIQSYWEHFQFELCVIRSSDACFKLYQPMKITFQTWYLSPEMPEGLPILKEGSGKGREIVHMIECFLSTYKSVGLTGSTWDYWIAQGLRNEIWRPSPLGHL